MAKIEQFWLCSYQFPAHSMLLLLSWLLCPLNLHFISVAELKAEAAKIELDQELSSQEEVAILHTITCAD